MTVLQTIHFYLWFDTQDANIFELPDGPPTPVSIGGVHRIPPTASAPTIAHPSPHLLKPKSE